MIQPVTVLTAILLLSAFAKAAPKADVIKAANTAKPNIVFIFADDWGWGDEHHFVRSVEDLALLFGHRIADEDPMPIELIEEAIVEAEKAVELFDETSCELEESLRELHRVHLSVCEALRPDPAELGRSLFRRQLEDPWGYLTEMLPDYLALIGAAGETAVAADLKAVRISRRETGA